MIKKVLMLLLAFNISAFADFYYSQGKKHNLKTLKTTKAFGKSSSILVQNDHGATLVVNNQLIVCFDDKSTQKMIENNYGLTHIKALTNSMHLYQVKDKTKTLSIANKIYEEKGVKFSHPDFKTTKKTRAITRDPHADLLWHLDDNVFNNHADINILPAWRHTKGAGVKVAVYDEGIDIDHIDLKENIYAYANFNDAGTNLPGSSDDKSWHGTAVAGILAAQENNKGGVGVAPQASLYAIRYSDKSISKDIQAYKWFMNEGVSVINNSWGTYLQLDAYEEIFEELATKGRNGKGIIIVFASGNTKQNLDEVGIHDESESKFVISVTASTQDNLIAKYSNFGSSIDFTAPGGSVENGLFTTDASGTKGYNNSDYNYNFVGTSGAAPIVSGTVALMLSANPKLTRNSIIEILKDTAQKLGNYPYDEKGRNNHWGYGKIDAGRAVELAISYENSDLKNFAQTMFSEIFE